MDPNAVLMKIRAAVEESFTVGDSGVDDIAEAFQALDEFLSKGGFLPAAWRHAHPMGDLDEIHALLSGNPWTPDTLDSMAAVLNRAGYEVLEPEPEPEEVKTPAPYFLGEKVEAAIEAAMAAHEPLKNDSVCACGVKNNMDGDVLFSHRVSMVVNAMSKAIDEGGL